MLDIRFIISNYDKVINNLKNRNFKDTVLIDNLIELYNDSKDLKNKVETLKNERNVLSKQIGVMKSKGEDAAEIMNKVKELPEQIKIIDDRISVIEQEINSKILTIPNMLDNSVPAGKDESENTVIKTINQKPIFDFEPKSHWDIGVSLGILDFERAAKITGSRFVILKNEGAQLERALINFMLDVQTNENGYCEILPPFIVNDKSLLGTGQLPKFEEDLFKLQSLNYYLVPTAEVPLTNIYRDEIIPGDQLPINITAYTPCFRAEAGSWGKDTRGIIRQHQFNKIELVKFTAPESSETEHNKLLENAESILKKLGLHYRVVLLCSGDTGFASSKTFDIEVWMPGQNKYREISSCSNFSDFQSRRANIKFRRTSKDKPELVHTINGSGLAVGRTLAAILENFQNKDGSVSIPEQLIPYIKKTTIK
ncbi:serine--tRNA ligase [Candidatus Dependentiae bacterium]|nr:serine--tRNA ligase [Candidatus Dependentiae bacterium]